MRLALDLARKAARDGEVPVAAIITRNGQVIASAANQMMAGRDPTAHAEMLAIRAAASVLQSQRLDGCEIWATLEPCAMCAGAISHARIAKLYYAASDPKGGGVEHGARVFSHETCHHKPDVYAGIEARAAGALLRDFFAARRSGTDENSG